MLSVHVPPGPVGGPCADLVQESSMRNVPGTFRKHAEPSGTFRNIPRKLPREVPQDSGVRNVSGTFLESFLGRFHRTQACGTFLEHSSKASSGASTGLRHAERSWNIPEHSSDVRYRPHTSRTASLFLIVDDRSDPVHFFSLIYHVGTLSTDSVRCMESAIPGRQHHIPSDL